MSTDELLNRELPTPGATGTSIPNSTMRRAMAMNLADWQSSSVQARGVACAYTDSLWWRQPGDAPIYLPALILDAQRSEDELFAEIEQVEENWATEAFTLWDCCGIVDLSKIGFEQEWKHPWYLRPMAPIAPLTLPEGLTLEIVANAEQLDEFERASWVGFEEPEQAPEIAFRDRKPFSWHAPSTLEDPGMHYLVARLTGQANGQVEGQVEGQMNGQVVAGVIVHATEDIVGIYGLSTLPEFRRRGYATTLVHASVALRPDLPVCVQPDLPTVPIYRGMGFVPGGEIASWRKMT